MRLGVDGPEPLVADVGVPLRRRDVGMTEDLLHHP
jgi:hypothetical protein